MHGSLVAVPGSLVGAWIIDRCMDHWLVRGSLVGAWIIGRFFGH